MTNDERVARIQALAEELGLECLILIGWEDADEMKDPIAVWAGSTEEGQAQGEKMVRMMASVLPFFNQ